MASGTGNTLITFTEPAVAAKYETKTVVTDSNPNPNLLTRVKTDLPYSSPASYWYADMQDAPNNLPFVKTSPSNTLYYSNNGINWLACDNTEGAASIAYGNGVYIGVSFRAAEDGIIIKSTNGINWTTVPGVFPNSGYNWGKIIYLNGLFIATMFMGGDIANVSSDNGLTWTTCTLPNFGSWYSGAYINGTYVLADGNSDQLAVSSDGITWTARTVTTPTFLGCTVSNGNVIVLFDANSQTSAQYSYDSINWFSTSLPISFAGGFSSSNILYYQGIFLASEFATNKSLISTDGINWNVLSTLGPLGSVGVAKGMFLLDHYTTPGGFTFLYRNIRTVSTESKLIEAALPTPGANQASVTITGLTGFNATDSVQAWIMGSDSTASNNSYEHSIAPIDFYITNPITSTGFTINAKSPVKLDGDFKVRYVWTS